MTAGRSLPSVAPAPFRDILPTIKQEVENPKGTIAIFTGCLLDFVYVDIAKAVVKGLNMSDVSKRDRVYQVFQRISPSYDSANDRISLGRAKSWKQLLIDTLLSNVEHSGTVLDVCCGTGDIAIAIAERRQDLTVTGLDFSPAMSMQSNPLVIFLFILMKMA